VVILVDKEDRPIGTMDKMEAHEKGLLHRAFSVFIFNAKGEMLLQQRSVDKYHSGGLWTNACCSHPMPGEQTIDAANRRLGEELGFSTPLEKRFSFIYKTNFDNGLTEHEVDHVFTGTYDGNILPNKAEVEAFKYCSVSEVIQLIAENPNHFTSWFKIAFPKLEAYLAIA
jgi:isopentenyl-diphosphate Delta-isomerase